MKTFTPKYLTDIELLGLNPVDEERLQYAIFLHRRYSTIEFRLKAVDKDEVFIEVQQFKPFHENVATSERLAELALETFSPYLPDKTLVINTIPYVNELR